MADATFTPNSLPADPGLSGQTVRGTIADHASNNLEDAADPILETVKTAARMIKEGFELGGEALEKTIVHASDSAFQQAADVGPNIATTPQASMLGQSAFSWSGYLQALGALCLLLAALWAAVWLIRRYGKFNFLPRPGSLPKDALIMEAQMPLGPKKGLMVVRFMNRRLLLGITEHQISFLTEENAQDERNAKGFQEFMDDASRSGTVRTDSHSA